VTPADVPEGPLVVDTDVLSMVMWSRGQHLDWEPLIDGHVLTISFVTVAEVRAGALIANFGDARRRELEEHVRQLVVLPASDAVTAMYAQLFARFRGRLKGGGVNDMWIAACALAQNPAPIPLATANLSDFRTIAGEFPLQIVHPDL
jgi:predicted nucleic acid-binding protein